MRLLHIVANPSPLEYAVERHLANAFLDALRERSPDAAITEVDLYADPPPYLDEPTLRYFWQRVGQPDYAPSDAESSASEYARRHCALVRDASVVALTAPVWNASVPAILKSWIDQIICPGETYRFGDDGPEGTHAVERVCVFTTSGAAYTLGEPRDCFTNLVRAAFGFIGIDRVDVVWADGQNRAVYTDHADRRARAIADATALAADVAG